ncbi:MAG: hypothetical protein AAGA11_02335 [Pseudomonadota bacterium]
MRLQRALAVAALLTATPTLFTVTTHAPHGTGAAAAASCPTIDEPRYVDLCAGVEPQFGAVRMLRQKRPAQYEAMTDPTFGTTIRRITDASEGEIHKPVYSTIQAWNADESYLVLYYQPGDGDGEHRLYDGQTYRYVRTLDIDPADLEEVFWHNTDPDILFYAESYYRKLYRYHVSEHRSELWMDFNKVCPKGNDLVSGGDVHMPSWDSRYMGFRCGGYSDAAAKTYIVDLQERLLLSVGTSGVGDADDDPRGYDAYSAPMPGPSGKTYFYQGDVLDVKQRKLRSLAVAQEEHSSLGRLPDGSDAFFAVGFIDAPDKRCGGSIGQVVAHNLETGECFIALGPEQGIGYPATSTHHSALARAAPGWVASSSVGETGRDLIGSYQKMPGQEIYLTYADKANPQHCRVAHHRSFGKDNTRLHNGYFAEPHVTISPSGTRLLFGSDWHGENRVDTYVVELPIHAACATP